MDNRIPNFPEIYFRCFEGKGSRNKQKLFVEVEATVKLTATLFTALWSLLKLQGSAPWGGHSRPLGWA